MLKKYLKLIFLLIFYKNFIFAAAGNLTVAEHINLLSSQCNNRVSESETQNYLRDVISQIISENMKVECYSITGRLVMRPKFILSEVSEYVLDTIWININSSDQCITKDIFYNYLDQVYVEAVLNFAHAIIEDFIMSRLESLKTIDINSKIDTEKLSIISSVLHDTELGMQALNFLSKDKKNTSPLYLSIKQKNKIATQIMLKFFPFDSNFSVEQESVLEAAVLGLDSENYKIVKLLLESNASPNLELTEKKKFNCITINGQVSSITTEDIKCRDTALHRVVKNNDHTAAALLLNARANVEVMDPDGKSVIEYAKDAEMKSLLLGQDNKDDKSDICLLS